MLNLAGLNFVGPATLRLQLTRHAPSAGQPYPHLDISTEVLLGFANREKGQRPHDLKHVRRTCVDPLDALCARRWLAGKNVR